jgi:hypothetical protein
MKQTAVEWLIEQIHPTLSITLEDVCIEQLIEIAKAMEKEQHFKSYRRGNLFLDEGTLDFEYYFEQYYILTYGK